MDNEASSDMKDSMTKHKISFQLAPPYTHHRNAAERSIRTFKNNFVAGFSTTDPNFPVSEWDRLLDQATITLNLLRHPELIQNFPPTLTSLVIMTSIVAPWHIPALAS